MTAKNLMMPLLFCSLLYLPAQAQLTRVPITPIPTRPKPIQLQCFRRGESALSPLAAAVLNNIRSTHGAMDNSPVRSDLILTTCHRFVSEHVDGPDIYTAVRDLIAKAQHEVDIAFYQWEHQSQAVSLIGDGLIAAQARRQPTDPLLVRIMIDDVDSPLSTNRAVNRLWNAQKSWVARGLDTSRVRL